jgi:hypothetical protein
LNRFRTEGHRLGALVITAIFLVLAMAYSLYVPLWEAPDEVGHFGFVSHLVQHRSLPLQRVGDFGEAHQPPLYYAAVALATLPANHADTEGIFNSNPAFIWGGQGQDINISLHGSAETFPFRGQALAMHLARAASALMGAVTVLFVAAIGWQIFPARKAVGVLSAAFVAFNPQFLFLSSVVNNDTGLVLVTTGGLWQLLRAIKSPAQTRQWLLVGVWIAAALLVKSSGLVLGAVAGLVLFGCALQQRSWRLLLRGAGAMLLVIGLIAGWWFVRNQLLYGDPLGWRMYEQVFAVNLRNPPLAEWEYRHFFSTQFQSFWGVFGWMTLWMPAWYYQGVRVVVLIAAAGVSLFLWQARSRSVTRYQAAALFLLLTAVILQEVYMLTVIQRCNASCYQGRYLFPIIGPLMLFVTLGLGAWLPGRLRFVVLGGLVFVLLSVSVFTLFRVIRPAYNIVAAPKWILNRIQSQTEYDFNSMIALRGYEVQEEAEQLVVTLYWQATQKPDFDYSSFVHLIDSSDQLVAQDDHPPGEAQGYAPTRWLKEDIIVDEHTIPLTPTLPTETYRLRVGLYNWSSGEQLPVSENGRPLGTFVILKETYQAD